MALMLLFVFNIFFACVAADVPAGVAGNTSDDPKSWSPLQTIPLQKQYVPIQKNGQVVAYKTAYFGTVHVGAEAVRPFTVVFDTGSGHFILPSTSCKSETCIKHRRYNRTESSSAVDIEYDGSPIRPDATERDQVSIAFGTGEVLGEFVQEALCLEAQPAAALQVDVARRPGCVKLRTVLATKMTDDPFGLFAFDGVLGLGLEALTLAPEFSFFAQMSIQHPSVQPRFAVYLSRTDGGESEISFGGHDERRANSELQWASVAMKELGYWQVQVKSVRIGQTVLEDCADGGCRAILDTGTSLLGVPRQAARTMHKMLARSVPNQEQYTDVSEIDCRGVAGRSLDFELVGGMIVSLSVEDYSRPTPFNMTLPNSKENKLFCRSLLLPVDMPAPLGPKVFIWGEPVLRRYYTVYDLAEQKIGFATASQPDASSVPAGLPPVGSPPPGSLVSGAPLPPRRPADAAAAAAAATLTV